MQRKKSKEFKCHRHVYIKTKGLDISFIRKLISNIKAGISLILHKEERKTFLFDNMSLYFFTYPDHDDRHVYVKTKELDISSIKNIKADISFILHKEERKTFLFDTMIKE